MNSIDMYSSAQPQPPNTPPHTSPPSPSGDTMTLMDLYFSPSGRINRSTFWLKGVLPYWLIGTVISGAIFFMLAQMQAPGYWGYSLFDVYITNPIGFIGLLFTDYILLLLVLLALNAIQWWIVFALRVKRLHDRDKSAWWILLWDGIFIIGWFLLLIPSLAVVIWMFIELGCLEGTPGRNLYGEATTQPYMYRQPGIAQQMPGVSPQAGSRTKDCPYCAETIMYDAIKCRYCRLDISGQPQQPYAAQPAPAAQAAPETQAGPVMRMKTCPHCAGSIPYEEVKCRYCGLEAPSETGQQPPDSWADI